MITSRKDTPEQTLSMFVHARPAYFLLFIMLLAALAYSNTLFSPLMLDDNHSFVSNSNIYINDFSIDSLKRLKDTPFGMKRFMPMLSFALNHKLSRGRIADYHLTNIAIHLLTGTAFFLFVLRLATLKGARPGFLPPQLMALIAAGLWLLNPVQTNAVTYLVQRMASMAAMFYVASLAFYLYGRTTRHGKRATACFIMSAFCAVAAFMSKENSATLPVAMIMTEVFFVSPGLTARLISKVRPWQWGMAAVVALLMLPPATAIVGRIANSYALRPFTMTERLLTESRVVLWYLSLLLAPFRYRLSLEHDFPVSHGLLSPPATMLSIATLAAIATFAWHKRKEMPMLSFAIFWYFLNLIIESTIIPLELVFEHRLYLPSMGVFLAIAAMFDHAGASLGRHNAPTEIKSAVFLLAVSLISASSVLTTLRNNDWRDQITISRDCAKKAPDKPRALSELGLALAENGFYEEGIKYSMEAIRKGKPKREAYSASATNIVVSLSRLGKTDEAIRQGEDFLAKAPAGVNQAEIWGLYHNLSFLYWQRKDFVKAFNAAARSLRMQRHYSNQKTVLLALNILSGAFNDPKARKMLRLVGDDQQKATILKIAELLTAVRDYNKADFFLDRAEAAFPDDKLVAAARSRLNNILEKNRRSELASAVSSHEAYSSPDYKFCWKSVNFIMKYYRPLMPLARALLDSALARYPGDRFLVLLDLKLRLARGKDGLDLSRLDRALKHDPDFIPLLLLAERVYSRSGETGKAIKALDRILAVYPGIPQWRTLQTRKKRLIKRLRASLLPDTAPRAGAS